ncbi:MAG: phosphonate ABC transporter ATP-binding protein [Desulfobaccales bacterium]
MIRLDDVSLLFPGGINALHPMSLEFQTGNFTVLLGSSGAGKSSLMRCLNLLQRPSTGTITVEGLGSLNNSRLIRAHRRHTAMIFQQHQLIGRHTAWQNVLLGRLAFHSTWRSLLPLPRRDQTLALECLERVGLLHKALERVDNLSGGEQQRVGIARALVQQPHLILADEPVASLDPATSHKILNLLKTVCTNDGITAIVSLHQVELATAYADRIIALAGGKVVFDGPPEELTSAKLTSIYRPEAALPAGDSQKTQAYWASYNLALMEE